jgi:hypothetical protein
MKRVYLLLLVSFFALTASSAFAQEFKMRLFPTFGGVGTSPLPIVIGYDPTALDTLMERNEQGQFKWRDDSAMTGESEWPGFWDADVYLYAPPRDAEFYKVSIKNKPETDTFRKVFNVRMQWGNEATSITLRRQFQGLNQNIRHVTLTATNQPDIILADFIDQQSVTFTRSQLGGGSGRNLELTIYYNLDLPTKSVKGHAGSEIAVSAYPNPAIEHSKVMIELPESAPLMLQMYDLQGRVVMQRSIYGYQGENIVDIDKAALGLPAGTYFIRAMIGDGTDQIVKTLRLQLQ